MAGKKKGEPRDDKQRPEVKGKPSRGAGRKRWKRTEADIQLVKSLAGRGLSAEHIAVHLKVSKNTLLKHACDAIDEGRALGIASVTGVLYKKAMDGSFKHAAYYLNNVDRENWSTTKKVEHRGKLSLEDLVVGVDKDE